MPELAERVMNLPVRRGAPLDVGGVVDIVSSPMYATGVGLILYGAKHREPTRAARNGSGAWQRAVRKMKDWAQEFF
jgi:cell division protein FtsA